MRQPRCGQATFSEQIPGLTAPFARRTPPLTEALAEVALALAGRPGSRLAAKIAILEDHRHGLQGTRGGSVPAPRRRHGGNAGIASG
jgi:hypothetical protein